MLTTEEYKLARKLLKKADDTEKNLLAALLKAERYR